MKIYNFNKHPPVKLGKMNNNALITNSDLVFGLVTFRQLPHARFRFGGTDLKAIAKSIHTLEGIEGSDRPTSSYKRSRTTFILPEQGN